MNMVGRLLIAVAVIAGSWEEILPGIADDAPWTSPCPDGESDPGEEIGLHAPLDVAALIPVESLPLPEDSLVLPSSFVVRRIPHVPKPALHV